MVLLLAGCAAAPSSSSGDDGRPWPLLRTHLPFQCVIQTPSGRVFLGSRSSVSSPRLRLVELHAQTLAPYPDAAWNSAPADPSVPKHCFASIEDLVVDSQGKLWVLDSSPRLISIDLRTDRIADIILLDSIARGGEKVDSFCLDDRLGIAYLAIRGKARPRAFDLSLRIPLPDQTGPRSIGEPDARACVALSRDGRRIASVPGKGATIESFRVREVPGSPLSLIEEPLASPLAADQLLFHRNGQLYSLEGGTLRSYREPEGWRVIHSEGVFVNSLDLSAGDPGRLLVLCAAAKGGTVLWSVGTRDQTPAP